MPAKTKAKAPPPPADERKAKGRRSGVRRILTPGELAQSQDAELAQPKEPKYAGDGPPARP